MVGEVVVSRAPPAWHGPLGEVHPRDQSDTGCPDPAVAGAATAAWRAPCAAAGIGARSDDGWPLLLPFSPCAPAPAPAGLRSSAWAISSCSSIWCILYDPVAGLAASSRPV